MWECRKILRRLQSFDSRDEEVTFTALTGHREIMGTLIANHNGRVIDSPGDNLLAAFSSVTQTFGFAVEIHREMAEKNEELPDDRKMEYRIGKDKRKVDGEV